MRRCIIRQASTFICAYVVNMYMLDASGNPFCHGTGEVSAHFWDVAIYIHTCAHTYIYMHIFINSYIYICAISLSYLLST